MTGRRQFVWAAATVLVSLVALPAAARQSRPLPAQEQLLKTLLFWFELPKDLAVADLSRDAEQEIKVYRQRIAGFKPSFVPPGKPRSPEHSVGLKRIALERVIAGLFDAPDITSIARDYARDVRPAYEWEGFADGPLSEAAAAEAFIERHPSSPITPYVDLFAGHRKLCAVSGLEGLDPVGAKAHTLTLEGVAQLERARDTGHPLISVVATRVLETRKCYGDG